jgi:universal stress protein family protein
MTIKHVLACVDGAESDRTVLDYALQVAQNFVSHVDVLHVRFDVEALTVLGARDRRGDRLLGIHADLEHAVANAAERAHRHFTEWRERNALALRDSGPAAVAASAAWHDAKGYERDVIAHAGRLCDLVVIAQPSASSASLSLMSFETALFGTSRPVLMVPEGPSTDIFYRPIIAWDASPEAARAVGYALPLLAQVRGSVEVFCANGDRQRVDAEELLRYLGWHGIAGKPTLPDDLSRSVSASLLAQAGASRAGLIVMGAYSHGHYRQFLFGGVTREVIQHARIPVLLAH